MKHKMRTIEVVTPLGAFRLRWPDGTAAKIDIARAFGPKVIAALTGTGWEASRDMAQAT